MCRVYAAEHLEQGRRVALKVLRQRLRRPENRPMASKARAGFALHRASGGRRRGGTSRQRGRPIDPHNLERLR